MLLLNVPLDQIQLFMFVLLRVGAILFTLPFLEARNVPVLVKVCLAIAISILVIPQLTVVTPSVFGDPVYLALGVLTEVGVGVVIGLTLQLVISGIQLAGQLAGFQMGFAIANVVDPASSLQIPIISQFLNLFALLIFFSINAHYYFIMALMDSFERIAPFGAQFDGRLLELIMKMTADIFVVALKIGAPITVALLLANVALGLTARTVPQMQLFIVAMPLKILLGLFFLGISLPFCMVFMQKAFTELGQTVIGMMRLFQ
jgi:flagellar biosynthesis protein FliR